MHSLTEQSTRSQSQPDIPCPHCGGHQLFVREQPPHIALRCAACDRWIKWVSRSDSNRFPQQPAVNSSPTLKLVPREVVPKFREQSKEPDKPADCGHCAEVSRLLKHLAGIERHLEIVTRALMGVGAR
jgi:hypothetical protein